MMHRAAALSAAVALLALAAPAPAQRQTQTSQQGSPLTLFRSLLEADSATTPTIHNALRSGRVFVDPTITFADVTGDAKQDAIVLLDSGGIGGSIALYVFSADEAKPGANGQAKLRAVYRNQTLYRVTARTSGTTLLVRTPVYKPGDDPCCPPQQLERTITWSARVKRMVLRSARRVDVPVSAVGTAPTTA